MSLASLDHVQLVGILNGMVAELCLYRGQDNAGLLCLKGTTARHVSIAIDSPVEREREREREVIERGRTFTY